jgi:hypothetical protein
MALRHLFSPGPIRLKGVDPVVRDAANSTFGQLIRTILLTSPSNLGNP